jgi:predicted nucleic acid-binding protein
VIVVSNSSPLITLARVGHLDLLRQLFVQIHIATEVRHEVVKRGAGKPAADLVGAADWIKTHPAAPADEVAKLRASHALGTGELATVLLGRKLTSDLAIIDERSARRLALANGLAVMGCVGILETGHRRGLVKDLRHTYQQLLANGIRIDERILNASLVSCGLPEL